MRKFKSIPQSTFEDMQVDAGMLVLNFDPTNPAPPADADIICATTGGFTATCKPTIEDLGSDIDNVPGKMKELQHITGYDCSIATTCIGTSLEQIRMSIGAADITASESKITPRDLKQSDFEAHIWWLGDKAGGGIVAICLKNALSTEGLSLKTTKNGKGQTGMTLSGFYTLAAQDSVPMEFYSMEADDDEDETLASVTQTLSHVTSTFKSNKTEIGQPFVAALTADDGYTMSTPTITMNGTSASSAYSNGFINIASVTGAIVITASATAQGG